MARARPTLRTRRNRRGSHVGGDVTSLLQTDRVLLTQRRYASTIVLRGCDLTTRRDVVIGEQESHVGNSGALEL